MSPSSIPNWKHSGQHHIDGLKAVSWKEPFELLRGALKDHLSRHRFHIHMVLIAKSMASSIERYKAYKRHAAGIKVL